MELETKLLEFDLDDEDDDLEFFKLDLEMKLASLKASTQGTPIDLDSMPNIRGEGTQQPPDVQFGFVQKPFSIGTKKLVVLEPISALNMLLALKSWNIYSYLKPHLNRTLSPSPRKRGLVEKPLSSEKIPKPQVQQGLYFSVCQMSLLNSKLCFPLSFNCNNYMTNYKENQFL